MSRTIALVTGANRGIGKSIARQLAADGFFVIGTSTSQQGADDITKMLKETGGAGKVLDVRDNDKIEEVFEQIESVYGHPQVLVNNAGITKDSLLLRMDSDSWDDVIDTNLSSVYKITKRALRGMIKAKSGRIINITSVVAAMGNPGQVNYAAAKAGIEGFTRSLAREIASRNITVNCVAPGFIESDMTNELDDRYKQAMLDAVPVARLGLPEDVANAVSFLASPNTSYVTGAVIPVNGGMYL